MHKKKRNPKWIPPNRLTLKALLGQRSYTNVRFARRLLAELNCTVNQCKKSVVLTHTHVVTGVVYCTSLTNDDVTGLAYLTAENLYTETLTS